MADEYAIVEYFSEHEGYRCGYCKSPDTNCSNGMWAHALPVHVYQNLIDRGWRRSGKYCYKGTMNKTCCPQYTIRCDALNFKLSKSQKKVLKKVHRFLAYGFNKQEEKEDEEEEKKNASLEGSVKDFPDSNHILLKASEVEMDSLATQTIKGAEKLKKHSSKPEVATLSSDCSVDKPEAASHSSEEQMDISKEKHNPKPGIGPDPSKPKCRKAKDIRKERWLKKLEEKAKAAGESFDASQVLSSSKVNPGKSLEDFLHEPITGKPAHTLKVRTVRSSPTTEEFRSSFRTGYEVYKQYQMTVHKDPPDKCSEKQYKRFLVDSPMKYKASSPYGLGSYHQQYWLDDKLIAVGVIDILVNCVSSVYLYYDPQYNFLTLGTYAALREITFVRELNKSNPNIRFYYMGFYIHSCPKMVYKGKYCPSYLLCPETYTWHPIEKCIPLLDKSKYSRLCEDSTQADENGKVDLNEVLVLINQEVVPYPIYARNNKHDRAEIEEYAQLVGKKCYPDMFLYRSSS